jgi:hypothetical protein
MPSNAIEHNEIHLELPQGWQDGSQVIALGPASGPVRPTLVVTREPAGKETLEQFAARQLPQLKAALPGLALVKEGPARFGPHSAFLREYNFTAEGQKLSQLQLYVLRSGIAYSVTFTQATAQMASTRQIAEEAFSKLKIG